MCPIKVREMMMANPIFISPETTLHDAACKMKEANCGVFPIGTPEKIEGIITDHDIVIRAMINGDHKMKSVSGYMTTQILFCHEDDKIEKAADIMRKNRIDSLVVKDTSEKIVGILSFGELLRYKSSDQEVKKIIKISRKSKDS